MTQEEKARAYDEAIERANEMIKAITNIGGVAKVDDIQYLFPELKESEDERIRKELIKHFKNNSVSEAWSGLNVKKVLAWLEKQKAIDVLDEEEREFADDVDSYRKDMDEFYKKGYNAGREAEKQDWLKKQDKKQQKTLTWKHWKNGIAGNGEGKPIYLIKHGYTYRLTACLSFECDYIELSELDKLLSEEQDEQKPQRMVSAEAKEAMYDKPAEWSKDDEYQINTILHELDLKREFCKKVGNKVEEYRYDTQYNWFISLKDRVQPQNTYKPSNEQMKCLSDVVHKAKYKDDTSVGGYSAYMPLASLYLDLKKLI